MLFFLQVTTFAIGLLALGLAIRHMVFFRRSSHHLSKSMIGMLVEQVVSASGTMLFSCNSLLATIMNVPADQWNNIPPLVAIVIRIAMFGAMVHSTVRLSMSVQKVLNDDKHSSN